jgi:hypothetical protein
VVEPGRGLAGISDGNQVYVAAEEKAAISVCVLVDANGQDGEAGLVVVELDQRWHLDDAGRAPGGPEVEQHYPAPVICQMNCRVSVGNGEIGRNLAGLGGMRAAVAAGRECHW